MGIVKIVVFIHEVSSEVFIQAYDIYAYRSIGLGYGIYSNASVYRVRVYRTGRCRVSVRNFSISNCILVPAIKVA